MLSELSLRVGVDAYQQLCKYKKSPLSAAPRSRYCHFISPGLVLLILFASNLITLSPIAQPTYLPTPAPLPPAILTTTKMPNTPLPVHSSGPLHGLPTYPSSTPSHSIIVTGANGISGSAMLTHLAASPHRWPRVYALSRRPVAVPPNSTNIIPIALDFLSSTPAAIAAVLKQHNVQAEYVYFASYVQPAPPEGAPLWSNVDELATQNVALLKNLLDALALAEIKVDKFLLQTGGKYYGLHLGPASIPMHESDPRHGLEQNFYFAQLDLLYSRAKTQGFAWVETRPCFILGAAATDAAMNIVLPLALYAAVQKRLGARLEFPGDVQAWEALKDQSTASLIADQAEWALLTPEVKDTALNHSDGSAFAWGKFWSVLAGWYGLEVGLPEGDGGKYAEITMPFEGSPRGVWRARGD